MIRALIALALLAGCDFNARVETTPVPISSPNVSVDEWATVPTIPGVTVGGFTPQAEKRIRAIVREECKRSARD